MFVRFTLFVARESWQARLRPVRLDREKLHLFLTSTLGCQGKLLSFTEMKQWLRAPGKQDLRPSVR